MMDFIFKSICAKSLLSPVRNRSCPEVSPDHSDRKMQRSFPGLADPWPLRCLFFAYYFEVGSGQREESYTYGCPSPVQSISVSEGKVMGLWGAGLGQSKQRRSQHSKQTLPHVWTTHLEPYSSPTHSRSPLAVLFLLTPPFFLAQLNTLLIPGPAHKSDRKSTYDKVSPPRRADFSRQLGFTRWGLC